MIGRQPFLLDSKLGIQYGQFLGIILVIVTLLFSSWYYLIRIDSVVTMSVRSKDWYREVRELEDYVVMVDKRKSIEVCSYVDGKRVCDTEYYYVSEPETRTRIINKWITKGTHPETPYWPTYTIGVGHYERKVQVYTIHLSDDEDVWDYRTGDEGYYNTFPVRGKCLVGLNWFNGILKVEC